MVQQIIALAILVGLSAFQIIWIAANWQFFKPGGQLHREIYHSEAARRLRAFKDHIRR